MSYERTGLSRGCYQLIWKIELDGSGSHSSLEALNFSVTVKSEVFEAMMNDMEGNGRGRATHRDGI